MNIEINMFWDGLFHALTWTMTAFGLALLWRAVKRRDVPLSTRTFVGSLPLGWGLFNLVEGLIDHELLGDPPRRRGRQSLPWDMAFLASGVVLILAGWATIRAGRVDVPAGRLNALALPDRPTRPRPRHAVPDRPGCIPSAISGRPGQSPRD